MIVLLVNTPRFPYIIIYIKKLLNSDWLRAVQFKCNTASAKSVTPVQLQVQKNYAKMIAKKKKLQKMMLMFIIINK